VICSWTWGLAWALITVLASGACGANTFAFEPDPFTLRHLRRNTELNRLNDLEQVYDCALGAVRGEAAFTVGLATTNRIAIGSDKSTIIVRMETLDDIVRAFQPVMMKGDVEGTELQVRLGASYLLAHPSLTVIELETVVPESAKILARCGFELARYDSVRSTLNRHVAAFKSSSCLFVRDWPTVADRPQTSALIEVLGRKI
jgi:FkbM family methyltransferase